MRIEPLTDRSRTMRSSLDRIALLRGSSLIISIIRMSLFQKPAEVTANNVKMSVVSLTKQQEISERNLRSFYRAKDRAPFCEWTVKLIFFFNFSAARLRDRPDHVRPVQLQQDVLYTAASAMRHDRRLRRRHRWRRLQWVQIATIVISVNLFPFTSSRIAHGGGCRKIIYILT